MQINDQPGKKWHKNTSYFVPVALGMAPGLSQGQIETLGLSGRLSTAMEVSVITQGCPTRRALCSHRQFRPLSLENAGRRPEPPPRPSCGKCTENGCSKFWRGGGGGPNVAVM